MGHEFKSSPTQFRRGGTVFGVQKAAAIEAEKITNKKLSSLSFFFLHTVMTLLQTKENEYFSLSGNAATHRPCRGENLFFRLVF